MRIFHTGNTDQIMALLLGFCLEAAAQAPSPIVLDGSTPGSVLGTHLITV